MCRSSFVAILSTQSLITGSFSPHFLDLIAHCRPAKYGHAFENDKTVTHSDCGVCTTNPLPAFCPTSQHSLAACLLPCLATLTSCLPFVVP
eukprot:1157924-Pelagomonas_calceolata.AAC.5